MNSLEFSLLVRLGSLAAGFLGSLTGLGGGGVIVPLLALRFGVDIRYASRPRGAGGLLRGRLRPAKGPHLRRGDHDRPRGSSVRHDEGGPVSRRSNGLHRPWQVSGTMESPLSRKGAAMGKDTGRNEAFGGPGIPPRWTHAAKDGVGTAYSSSSRLWFTLWNGVVTEVYYPTVDRPQLRDLQFLITDGESFFHEEKRHLRSATERLPITSSDTGSRTLRPGGAVLHRQGGPLRSPPAVPPREHDPLRGRCVPEAAPTLRPVRPPPRDGRVGEQRLRGGIAGRKILAAEKDGIWLALAATVPFSRLSCGYVGASDGWTDLAVDYRMDWEFDRAMGAGNIALPGSWTWAIAGVHDGARVRRWPPRRGDGRSWRPSRFPSGTAGTIGTSGTGRAGDAAAG